MSVLRLLLLIILICAPVFGQSGNKTTLDNSDFGYPMTGRPIPPTDPAPAAISAPPKNSTDSSNPAAFEFTDLNNQHYNKESLRGKVVIIDYWASWCGPCKAAIPSMVRLKETYGNRVVILGISLDRTLDALNNFIATNELGRSINYPIVYDINTKPYFGKIAGIPTTVIIDKRGDVRDKHVGAHQFNEFEALIDKLLAEPN
jgi:thiol-disulfide isomerase/thioredoxin